MVFAIYFDLADAPGMYVVRSWNTHGFGAQDEGKSTTWAGARALIPPKFIRLGRSDHDADKIIETWVRQ